MAKRSSSGLSSLSIEELNKELKRRQRALPSLQRKRAGLLAKVAKIDEQISVLGGAVGSSRPAKVGGKRRGRPPGSGGRKNDGSLVAALHKLLEGKTMSVTDAGNAVKEAGYKSDSPNFRTMVNAALLKKQFFKRVSRGQYTSA
jgi:hypothetical protein